MSRVQNVAEIHFPTRKILIYWEIGEDSIHGREIQLSQEINGDLEGINNWSFGPMLEVWEQWGTYLESKIQACKGDEDLLNQFIKTVDSIHCEYRPEDKLPHLLDYENIYLLINEN